MKKGLLILIALITLIIAGLYIFIPGRITVRKSITINATQAALLRKFGNNAAWKDWWPGEQPTGNTSATYLSNGIKFTPGLITAFSLPVFIDATEFKTSAQLTFIAVKKDSATIQIETSVPVSSNPLKRIETYFKSQKLENSFSEILQSINTRYSTIVNLYDYDIQKKSVVDSILVFTSREVKGYPSIGQIYSLIDELKSYIKKNSAEETGFPMLNIFPADSLNYLVKVAIPVNKKLADSGNIHYKWMLGRGNILITEVKGGQTEIDRAYTQIVNYISDYGRIAPAIPFESLVTDRRQEPDSSKWITRIYYPVI